MHVCTTTVYLTLLRRGEYSSHVCLSVTVLVGAPGTWQAKLRDQQKALDLSNKINFGMLLKCLVWELWQFLAHRENFTWCLCHKIYNRWLLGLLLDYWYIECGVYCCKPRGTNWASYSHCVLGTWLYRLCMWEYPVENWTLHIESTLQGVDSIM